MSIIYGERIRLRAVEREDLKKYFDWVNDPEVTYGLSLYLPISLNEEEKWFERVANRAPDERPLAIEVRAGDGWRLIGNCTFFDIDHIARSAEVGIMIGDKGLWNQGFGTETMYLLQRHGFETLNLNRIFLKVYADNLRAKRAYEKAGFIHEGTQREAVFKRGKFGDILVMSVLQREWEKRKKENQ
jgi:RimJ/RimL family protein N-acetyltransferase